MNDPVILPSVDDPAPSLSLRYALLLLAPLAALALWQLSPPAGMPREAWLVSCMALVMVTWWVTETLPLAVTALIPLIILPASGTLPLRDVSAHFGNPIIFLFLGGFLLSVAMQKWKLHLRLAYLVARSCAFSASALLGGLMLATGFLAMWISNTATVILMLPIAMSLAAMVETHSSGRGSTARAMALGIAYSAAIGGLSSFIGTPTNALLYGHMQTHYAITLDLGRWMMFGIPTTLLIGAASWWLLTRSDVRTRTLSPTFRTLMQDEMRKLGPMSAGEKRTLMIFLLAVSGWLFGDAISAATGWLMDDTVVAIAAGLALFITPVDRKLGIFALEWNDAQKVPWGVLIFFGGSLALSAAMVATGFTGWLGTQLEALHGVPPLLIVITIVALIIAASEMMSNVATISVFLPILSVLAESLQVHPLLFLLPATLAASCGFMLPGASAANALAYGTGYVSTRMMLRKGFLVDIISLIVIVLITFTLAPLALGTDLFSPPA